MPMIRYIDPVGQAHALDVAAGTSIMRGAVINDVPGILAECGGACACATCQVVVDAAWADKVPPPGPMEKSMLDFTEEDGPPTRLSCQIVVTPELDGLVVRIPAEQA